jgi:UDP-2,4-diacetamido-2,4,6-trideoxy-beta-L-altropyranose hydrolase
MKIIIRVDSSKKIGSGHVTRCLTLAVGLRDLGVIIEFVARDHSGSMIAQINNKGFKVNLLPAPSIVKQIKNLNEYEEWLGVKQSIDANETIQIISNMEVDWLIVDHYALDHKWEKRLRPYTGKIMVIDDLANRIHDCEILLDQNLFKDISTRYQGKTPKHCIHLLGPKYALLQPDYAKFRKQVQPRQQPPSNLLIFFGGVDQHNLTGLTLAALKSVDALFNVDVIMSKQSPHYKMIKNQIDDMLDVQLYSDLPSLAPLVLKADLAIGAGGSTTWERLCLGLPSLVVTLADNQRVANNYLYQLGLIDLIGDIEVVTKADIVASIERKLNYNSNSIKHYTKNCMEICSGQGINFVTNALFDF